jgi:hypothetical protein
VSGFSAARRIRDSGFRIQGATSHSHAVDAYPFVVSAFKRTVDGSGFGIQEATVAPRTPATMGGEPAAERGGRLSR